MKSWIFGFAFLLSIFLSACGSTEKYKPTISKSIEHSKVVIYRPKEILTLTQGVELSIDDKTVGKLWHPPLIPSHRIFV